MNLAQVVTTGLEAGHAEGRLLRAEVGHEDAVVVLHFVDGEAELLREAPVEAGGAVHLEAVRALVDDGAILDSLGFAFKYRKFFSTSTL